MFLIIIKAVIAASIGVLIQALFGAYLSKIGAITKTFTTQLSGVVERVFLPSLIFTSFLKATTLYEMLSLLPIVVTTFVCIGLGYIMGIVSNKYWIKQEGLRQIILLASANPHTTNIPLQLSYGLSYLFSQLMNIDQKDAETRLITTIMIQTVIVNSLRWSLGKKILMKYSQQVNDQEMSDLQEPIQGEKKEDKHKSCWNMPLYSVIAACFCLLIPPLQQELVGQTFLHQAIFLPLNTLGKASPPAVLIILGSNLYFIYQGEKSVNINNRTLMLITCNRLLIFPFVGICIIFILQFTILEDKCQCFILFLTFCTPSAINILVMAKQYTDNAEDVVSMILLFGYLGCIVTLPVWMIFYFNIMF